MREGDLEISALYMCCVASFHLCSDMVKYRIIFRIGPVYFFFASNLLMPSSYVEKVTATKGHLEFFLLSGAWLQKT